MSTKFLTLTPLWWGALFGTVLGGNFTPIASPAGVLVLGIYDRIVKSPESKKAFFRNFFITGAIAAIITLVCATMYLVLFIYFFS